MQKGKMHRRFVSTCSAPTPACIGLGRNLLGRCGRSLGDGAAENRLGGAWRGAVCERALWGRFEGWAVRTVRRHVRTSATTGMGTVIMEGDEVGVGPGGRHGHSTERHSSALRSALGCGVDWPGTMGLRAPTPGCFRARTRRSSGRTWRCAT